MKKILNFYFTAFLMVAVVFLTSCGPSGKHLGIATYSVKGIESDIEGSFQALADDGYVVMEISNYNAADGTVAGYKPAEYAALAEKYGIDIISSHTSAGVNVQDPEGTLAAWGKIFDDHKTMGSKYVILPMNFWSNNVEGLEAECALMNKIGEEANKRGLKFGYHNHSIEFAVVPGTDQMYEDFLIANTDPDKVLFEMDVYWTTFGDQDPVAYLQKYPDRIKVLHIKDDYVIGESGKIDYKAIFDQFYKNGNKDWFVEIEEKMTPEQMAQTKAMMDMLKNMMLNGGGNPFARRSQQQQGDEPDREGPPPQEREARQDSTPPMPGFGRQDPEVVAQKLKESLEACKLSAEYLKNADFVK
jgi:sugar phosphate isomerase/epimerase